MGILPDEDQAGPPFSRLKEIVKRLIQSNYFY